MTDPAIDNYTDLSHSLFCPLNAVTVRMVEKACYD